MIVTSDGGQVGTLGGGCVEAEVKQRAIRLLGRKAVERHEFVLDHDYAWADGLICGGKMVILAESLLGDDQSLNYYSTLLKTIADGHGHTEAIVVDAGRAGVPLGTRTLFNEHGNAVGQFRDNDGEVAILGTPDGIVGRPRPAIRNGVVFLPTLPRIRLIIIGAGHVGQAVAELAAKADFEVVVADDRRQYANAERFPTAARLIVGPLDEVLPSLPVNENTYALIVTRGHGHDQEALFHLVSTVATYVGLIGSRRKIHMIFDALREQGVSTESLARVAAPIGLDIGSESVPEIAISIVAELIAVRNLGKKPESVSSGASWR